MPSYSLIGCGPSQVQQRPSAPQLPRQPVTRDEPSSVRASGLCYTGNCCQGRRTRSAHCRAGIAVRRRRLPCIRLRVLEGLWGCHVVGIASDRTVISHYHHACGTRQACSTALLRMLQLRCIRHRQIWSTAHASTDATSATPFVNFS